MTVLPTLFVSWSFTGPVQQGRLGLLVYEIRPWLTAMERD